jgi:octaprenyl-diphosphate synthase
MLNNTLASLVSGEIKQLHTQGDLNISISDYEQTIYCKTGALFELATAGAGIISGESDEVISTLQEYGKQLGIAFQVADDILDYTSSSKTLGKNIGEDLEDGRITLPLILALQNCSSEDRKLLEEAIRNVNLDSVLTFINKTDSIQKSKDFALAAVEKAKKALSSLPQSQYRENLEALALKAATRNN